MQPTSLWQRAAPGAEAARLSRATVLIAGSEELEALAGKGAGAGARAAAAETGAATVILSGISLGLESAVYKVVTIAVCIYLAFLLGGSSVVLGLFFIALAGCGTSGDDPSAAPTSPAAEQSDADDDRRGHPIRAPRRSCSGRPAAEHQPLSL